MSSNHPTLLSLKNTKTEPLTHDPYNNLTGGVSFSLRSIPVVYGHALNPIPLVETLPKSTLRDQKRR